MMHDVRYTSCCMRAGSKQTSSCRRAVTSELGVNKPLRVNSLSHENWE